MRKLMPILMLLFLLSCRQSPSDKLMHINGYWEISEAKSAEGSTKSYTYNTTIDYIYIEDNKGIRKKLQPGINNQYKTSEDVETLEVKIENDSLNLYYQTNLSNWKETVLLATEDELKIVNSENTVYVYKRYEPVNLNLE